jgi:hypothetical protein
MKASRLLGIRPSLNAELHDVSPATVSEVTKDEETVMRAVRNLLIRYSNCFWSPESFAPAAGLSPQQIRAILRSDPTELEQFAHREVQRSLQSGHCDHLHRILRSAGIRTDVLPPVEHERKAGGVALLYARLEAVRRMTE